MDWLTQETIAVIASVLSITGGGIAAYVKLLSHIRATSVEYDLKVVESRAKERQQLLEDFRTWYEAAKASFQEVRALQLELQMLRLHVQELEHVMRRHGIEVPERPVPDAE